MLCLCQKTPNYHVPLDLAAFAAPRFARIEPAYSRAETDLRKEHTLEPRN